MSAKQIFKLHVELKVITLHIICLRPILQIHLVNIYYDY